MSEVSKPEIEGEYATPAKRIGMLKTGHRFSVKMSTYPYKDIGTLVKREEFFAKDEDSAMRTAIWHIDRAKERKDGYVLGIYEIKSDGEADKRIAGSIHIPDRPDLDVIANALADM